MRASLTVPAIIAANRCPKPQLKTLAGPVLVVCTRLVALLLLLLVPLTSFAHAAEMDASATPRIHLRGTARIDAHAAHYDGKLVVSGTVTDDLGAPGTGARVAVSIARGDASTAMPLSPLAPETCDVQARGSHGSARSRAALLEGVDHVVVAANDSGAFCMQVALSPDRYVAQLEALSAGFVDGAKLDIPVDLAQPVVALRFDPARTVLSLDDGASTIGVLAQKDGGEGSTAAADLALSLFNEAGVSLGQARTDASGRARFTVPSETLGPAGAGELRVAFGGSAEAGPSAETLAIERRAVVRLTSPAALAGKLPQGSPEGGISVRIVASLACAARGCAGSPTGTIEARAGDGSGDGALGSVVGAATIERGEAQVIVTFTPPAPSGSGQPGDITLRFRYVPDAPWFRPESGPVLTLLQPVQPPGPWRRAALGLAGLGVLAWLGLARLPPGSLGRRRAMAVRAPDDVERPGVIEHVARPDDPLANEAVLPSWSGRVRDAHDGNAIAGARIAVERPGFEKARIVIECTTDADGAFILASIDLFEVKAGDRLVAEAPLHSPVRRPLPPAGELRIALVARRRAILDRFVAWARQRGRPFDATPDPTPRHVRNVAAGERSSPANGSVATPDASGVIESWADAVEVAVFGGPSVDAEVESRVDRLAPTDARRVERDERRTAEGENRGEAPTPPRVHPASRRPGG